MGASTWVFLALYVFLIIFGGVGNSMVVHVVRKTPSMQTVTNFLLTNLAIADVFTLILSPFVWNTIFQAISHPSGRIGDIVCVLLTGNCFIEVTINVSAFTLCILAVERFHALVKPMSIGKRLSKNTVKHAICGTWIISILVCIPSYTAYRYKDDGDEHCFHVWGYKWSKENKVYVISTLCLFATAFLLISYCYIKIIQGMYFTNTILANNGSNLENDASFGSKKKLTIMFLTATINFIISYLPILFGMTVYGLVSTADAWKKQETLLTTLQDVSWLLVFSSCSLNPLLYHLQSESYRQGFVEILGCRSRKNGPQRNPKPRVEMHTV